MSKLLNLFLAFAIMTSCLVEAHGHHHHDHDHDHDHDHSGHDEHHHHSHPHDTEGKYATESHVLILTDDTLPQAIEQFPLLLVKFFAPWCGHCKTLAATYKELAIDLAHNGHHEYAIAEVDCTIHKNACNTHGIRGYPTLKYFIDGESHQYSGSRSKEALTEFLYNKQQEVRNASAQQQL